MTKDALPIFKKNTRFVITLGVTDDKLHQAITRHLLKMQGIAGQSVQWRTFKDDEDLREILGTTGIPFFDPILEALGAGELDLAAFPGAFIPLFMPERVLLTRTVYENDPWVLVTQSGDELLEAPDGDFTVGGMSRTALGWWKSVYPGHKTVRVETDVHTRLLECSVGSWDAGLFKRSELDLLSFEQHYDLVLEHAPKDVFQGFYGWLTNRSKPASLPDSHTENRVAETLMRAQQVFLRHLGAKPAAPVSFDWTFSDSEIVLQSRVFPPASHPVLSAEIRVPLIEMDRGARELAAGLLQAGAGEWVSGPHAED